METNEKQTPQTSFSFVQAEKDILAFWKKENIFKKTLEKTRKGQPYIFYDGPPFATGLPHHGHLVSSTLKDIVPRYFTMKGRYVERRFGWDCHGLPIEQEIDKKFGCTAQEYVNKHGVKAYNDECRGIVLRYTQEWESTISRLGRWVDFQNDYKTMDRPFMESIWWVFKELWKKGLIYKGEKVVPVSTPFGTVLSNFEATSNYQDVQDPSLTLMFAIKDQPGVYLSAWTTTPWTLPSNLALCVNKEITYARVKDSDSKIEFYIAEDRLPTYSKKHKLEVLSTHKGAELVGLEYEPLFPYFEHLRNEGAFQVIADEFVSTSDGTGVVHIAPAFGEDDNRVMKQHGIKAIICPVDMSGRFTPDVFDYQGQYIKDVDKQIIKRLKEEGKLYEQSVLVHAYPFCPRTDTPLIYRAVDSWYVNVSMIKDSMVKANQEIHWVPDHIKDGRFGKWLEGARDWAISRGRVWGTPLPIWYNEEAQDYYCVGSIEELKSLTGVLVDDLHREVVDSLTFTLEGKPGIYKRIEEVLDCWFESGSMPYAQLHYPFENRELFENNFPAEYIAEGLDQTRGWFYTLTVLAAALFQRPAFKNVIVNGMVLAKDGKKMSKRLRNYTPPDILMESFGADALRLFLINSGLVRAEELRFTDDGVKDMVRRALLPWFNAFKFFQTYAELDGWTPEKHLRFGPSILDRWILSRLQTLIEKVNREMQGYHLYNVVPALFDFIEDLTNWYIRLNRRRYWEKGLDIDKQEAYSTLYITLKELTTLMAPFTPFLSEHIYLELKKFGGLSEQSVHLLSYPEVDEKFIDATLEDAVVRMQQIVLLGRQRRNQVQVKVKTPLSKLTILHQQEGILNELRQLESFIQIELNVKAVNYSQDEAKHIRFFAKPNSPLLGQRFGKRFGEIRGAIEKLGKSELSQLEAGEEIVILGEKISSQEVLIFRESLGDSDVLSNRFITIKLDTQLDDALLTEGLAREIVNRIQRTRKELNLHVADHISITFDGVAHLEEVIEKHSEYIMQETLCDQITKGLSNLDPVFPFEIEGEHLQLTIRNLGH